MNYYRKTIENGSTSYSRSTESYDRSNLISKASFIPDGNGTTGLKNIGNTCFMNSMIQCLSHTVQLRDYCLRREFFTQINPSSSMRGKLIKAFSDVIKDLWSSNGQSSVTPSSFKSQIQKFSPRFMGYEQQDSQEFLRFLLEGLHEDINQVHKKSSEPLKDLSHMRAQDIARETWNWYGKKDKSFIFDLFVGQLESHLQCSYCNHVSLTYDPFWDLSLPISKGGYDPTTLSDCLRSFTREETLDRDEKPMCERCKTRRRMTKKLSIHRFPKILVIHLKRFNEGSRYRQKLSNTVKFPVTEPLKLTQFSSETCDDRFSASFDLYAVSNHLGSCYGGHYTAFCMNPHSRQWHEFDDSRVSNLSQSLVCTKEAYVLFYVQRCENGRSSRL